MPTLRQERLAEALENPAITTKTEAMIVAGYPEVSARANMSRAIVSAGTQRARRQIQEQRSDSARALVVKGTGKLLKRIEDDSISDAGLVMAVKTGHEIQQSEEIQEEKRLLPPSYLRSRRRRKALRHYINGVRAALSDPAFWSERLGLEVPQAPSGLPISTETTTD